MTEEELENEVIRIMREYTAFSVAHNGTTTGFVRIHAQNIIRKIRATDKQSGGQE